MPVENRSNWWSALAWPPTSSALVAGATLTLAAGAFTENIENLTIGRHAIRTGWLVLFLCVAYLLWRQVPRGDARSLIQGILPVWLIIAFAFLSVLWSYDPALTARRAVLLLGATLTGVLIGSTFSPRTMMRFFFWLLTILIFLNLSALIIAPDSSITSFHRENLGGAVATEGVFGNKNRVGMVSAVALLFFLIGTVGNRIDRIFGCIMTGFAALTLFLAQSATAYVGAAAGIGSFILLVASRRARVPYSVLFPLFLLCLALGAYTVSSDLDTFASILGRDATLTNRTLVWSDATAMIWERPMLGYGFGSVWALENQSWLPRFETTMWASDAHNGYLHLATQIGLPMAVVAVGHLGFVLYSSLRGLHTRFSPFFLFCSAFVVLFLVLNMAETTMYTYQHPHWMMFVAVSTALHRLQARRRPSNVGQRSRRMERLSRAAANQRGAGLQG